MPTAALGKQRRLAGLADHDGRMQIVSALPGIALDGPVTAAEWLSTHASAVVAEPSAALPAVALSLDRGAALVTSLTSASGDEPLGLIGGWSISKSVRCAAGAAWLALDLPLAGDQATRAKAEATVEMLADECAKHELPFVLELRASPEVLGEAATELLAGATRWSAAETQVDLLAVRPPPDADAAWLAELGAAISAPWLLAGAPGADDALLRWLSAAAEAGCCGFYDGGAVWRDDSNECALRRLRRLILESEACRPWSLHPRHAGFAVDGDDDWPRTY